MSKRFLLTTLAFTSFHVVLYFALHLSTLFLMIIFLTEEGKPNFVEAGIVPALFQITAMLTLPGDLLAERLRGGGTPSAFNPLLKQGSILLSSLLWGVLCALVWTRLRPAGKTLSRRGA